EYEMKNFCYGTILVLLLSMQLQPISYAKNSANQQALATCADVLTYTTSSVTGSTALSSGLIPFNLLAGIVTAISGWTSFFVGKHSKEWCTQLDQKSAKSSI
ncbi:MAG: hypothetical protein DI620_01730, partial [Haemophilus parainfluenzae]